MTAVEKIISQLKNEISELEKKIEKYSEEVYIGHKYGLDHALAITESLLEMEKDQHQETWESAHQAGRFEGKGIAEENWQTFETHWEETFKSGSGSCSCSNGIIVCPGCDGEKQSEFGVCAGCYGKGKVTCGKCGGTSSYLNRNKMTEIKNGDVFDIGQTVNGVSKFLWFNDKWYYFEERITRGYEYDQDSLTLLVAQNDFHEATKLGNILENFK